MEIGYFPQIYPDELIYSVLARFYVHSGYPAYTFCAEDIFLNKRVRPDMEFLNVMKPERLESLCKKMSMAELIEKHTMFPYYARFLPHVRRNRAFEALCSMGGDYNNLLAIPKQKNGEHRYLRYCPLCVKEDRTFYGESYWHRSHQLTGVGICPVHGCKLSNSSVMLSGKASPNLVTAEQEIKEMDIIFGNEIEKQLAGYVRVVFQSAMDMKNPIAVGQFLHSEMSGTEYLSVRGEQRNIQKFYDDFMVFYKELPEQGLTELWQIQKVFNNYRLNCFEVCQIAMFLNVPIEKLCSMELPDRTQEQLFDDKVKELHKQGLRYPEIAKRMGMSYDSVKAIGNGRYGMYQHRKENPQKGGVRAKDWTKLDDEYLTLVQRAIQRIENDESSMPKKITVVGIERDVGLPEGSLRKMPKCKAEINNHSISQEQLWAKKVVWVVQKILVEGQPLNWKHIRDLTNMRNDNFQACKPYLAKYADADIVERIKELL